MESTIDRTDYTGAELEIEEIAGGRPTLTRVRVGVFYLSLILAAVMTVLFLPELLVLLVTGWTADAGAALGIHRLHVMGIAAVVAVFLVGLFVQAYRPRTRVASMWGALLVISVVSAGTVGLGVGRPEEVLPFLLLASVAFVSHPAGWGLLRRIDSADPVRLALVAVAAVPLLAFALTQLTLSANAGDSHAIAGHYVMLVGLVTAPLAFGAFAALGFAGSRLASWLAALPIAYYGLLSLSFPAQAGSTGSTWGILAILWAIAFVATAAYANGGRSAFDAVAEYTRAGTATTRRR